MLTSYLDSGISIPSTYSSYMSPVSYAKIYHALSSNSSNNNPLTIPYVVKLKSARILGK